MLKYQIWFEKNKPLFYNRYNVDSTNLSIIPPSSPNEPRSPVSSSPVSSPLSWERVRGQFNNYVSTKESLKSDEKSVAEHKKFIALWTKHALKS